MNDYRRHFPRFSDSTITAFYDIADPYSPGRLVVFGDGEMGWYDWLAVDDVGKLRHRTADQYGVPEIALRDALNWATARVGIA